MRNYSQTRFYIKGSDIDHFWGGKTGPVKL